MLTLPNLERLKVFHLVYLNRSIQKAADLMSVTRSAVSQSLKSLEEELGFGLFIRDAKNFHATPEAETLFQTIDPFVTDLRSVLRHLEDGLKTPVGHLRIGAPMDFGSGQLTRIIGKFRKIYPAVSFELQLAVPVKQLELLCDGKLDMAFIDNGDVHAGKFPVTIQSFMREEFVMVASETLHKKLGLRNPTFQGLSEAPIVDYLAHAPVAKMWFKHHFGKEPADLQVAFSAESVQAVLNAVAGDLGIGVVPDRLIAGEYKSLKVVETSRGPFVNQIVIARQQGKKASVREKEFLKFCRSEMVSR